MLLKIPSVLEQSVRFVETVTVGLLLSAFASITYALTWYVAPATIPFTPNRFKLGPSKLCVRPEVSKLCVLPNGSGIGETVLARVGEPNGVHPSTPSANVYVAIGVPLGGGAVSVMTTLSR